MEPQIDIFWLFIAAALAVVLRGLYRRARYNYLVAKRAGRFVRYLNPRGREYRPVRIFDYVQLNGEA